ncbi:hypothetical protein HX881_17940 [Pseudomonas gingeri]|uniref:hypothetical protein n=1 Tax=Pseudomonas TaxID=286 RepID=UPI0015A3954C|nr:MULTISPECIES: hypothetical protein [Pseudomonas]NVZ27443.1 hypothetical protein [Pseudomonas gingeri]BBP75194.1 hypothetical protein PHLH7_12980 [Pseudomonas sp. Ost2]
MTTKIVVMAGNKKTAFKAKAEVLVVPVQGDVINGQLAPGKRSLVTLREHKLEEDGSYLIILHLADYE